MRSRLVSLSQSEGGLNVPEHVGKWGKGNSGTMEIKPITIYLNNIFYLIFSSTQSALLKPCTNHFVCILQTAIKYNISIVTQGFKSPFSLTLLHQQTLQFHP